MTEYQFHYSRFPHLRAYIDRVGAEQINFRRFIVREQHRSGYYEGKAIIRIVDGCEIQCSNAEYAPTESEAADIAIELAKVEWPYSIRASWIQAEELAASDRITGKLHIFPDNSRKQVIMCEERREKQDGGKIYLPWTLFMAKGESPTWRCMEPDGALPFWKPRERRAKANVMVHEGAKKAAHIDALINDPELKEQRKAHPWAEQLSHFEHWGANGGAKGIHRCDYEELRKERIEGDLYYVADNDAPGEEAAQTFSRMYGGPLLAIMFGNGFPRGWDMAENFPEKLLNGHGPVKLWELTRPATYATKVIGRRYGRDVHDLSEHFAKEWAHTITPELYINQRWPRLAFSKDQFCNYVAPFAHRRVDVAELLKARVHGQAETVKYKPGLEAGFHSSPNGTFFNVYQHRYHEPYGPKEKPDLTLFEDYMAWVFPIEKDRHEVKRWLATMIAQPGVKMRYGLLLVSDTQGVGKTTLGMILIEVLGPHNVSSPSEEEIVVQDWTYWMERRLVVINEIYAGHSDKAYNKLKNVITDNPLRIKKKFLDPYEIDNHIHVLACSNSMKALRLDNTDRRWLVPKVTEHKRTEEEWKKFYHWLYREQGARKIAHWAKQFLEIKANEPVGTGADAPDSSTKMDMIKESYSQGMWLIDRVLEWIRHAYEIRGEDLIGDGVHGGFVELRKVVAMTRANPQQHFVMFDKAGREAIRECVHRGQDSDKLESPMTIRKVAKNADFHVGEERIKKADWKAAHNARLISLSRELASMPVAELIEQKVPWIDLKELAVNLEELGL